MSSNGTCTAHCVLQKAALSFDGLPRSRSAAFVCVVLQLLDLLHILPWVVGENGFRIPWL